MRILIACEFSGIVRDAFIARGHDAWSCDLLPTERDGPHLQCNVLNAVNQQWDLMIAFPPCTYLANSGVRWLSNPERHAQMVVACEFFNHLLGEALLSKAHYIPRIAVENPIQHGEARQRIRKYDQIIQPWQHGHAETKATCLWLKGLPKLQPTEVIAPDFEKYPRRVQVRRETGEIAQGRGSGFATRIIGGSGGYEPRVHFASPSPDRWKERSRTLTGIADAMADQWGSL